MYKQVIVIRKDLEMGKGKLACHACHAAVSSVRKVEEETIKKWEKEGSEKVVLKIDSLKKLRDLYKKAKDSKLPCSLISDAGLTQLEKGTVTCIGIGPAEEKRIDRITGKLKLL